MATSTPTKQVVSTQLSPMSQQNLHKTGKKKTARDAALEVALSSPRSQLPVAVPPAPVSSHQPAKRKSNQNGLMGQFTEVEQPIFNVTSISLFPFTL